MADNEGSPGVRRDVLAIHSVDGQFVGVTVNGRPVRALGVEVKAHMGQPHIIARLDLAVDTVELIETAKLMAHPAPSAP
jgi:hypothetical protein